MRANCAKISSLNWRFSACCIVNYLSEYLNCCQAQMLDMMDIAALRAAVRPNTRSVLIETPSNPLMKIADLPEVASIARGANAISVCDGTLTTPVLQRPLDGGVDMVWHSTTKYISGHSDVTGGALITRYDNYLFERARKSLMFGGAAPSAFDWWLTLRGVSTLPWRMRALRERTRGSGILQRHPAVERVHYPGLPDHQGHEIARRQMSRWEVCCPSKCEAVAKRRWLSPGAYACSHGPQVWAAYIVSSSTGHRLKVPAQKRRKTCCALRLV
jgi:cystathionine beta-lyase/cystathionine gamma-synthase